MKNTQVRFYIRLDTGKKKKRLVNLKLPKVKTKKKTLKKLTEHQWAMEKVHLVCVYVIGVF